MCRTPSAARLTNKACTLAIALLLAGASAGCASLATRVGTGSTLFGHIPLTPDEEQPLLQPDRPDHTNATYTVPASLVQMEVGGWLAHVGAQGEVLQTPASVRVGLGTWFEGRFDTNGVTRDRQLDGSVTRFAGATVGGKFRVWAAPGGWVLAVMPQVTLPWGRGQDSGTDLSLTFLTGRDLTDWLHLDANYQVTAVSTGQSRFAAHMVSASASVSATKNWQPYAELYWISRTDPGGPHVLGTDAGAIYTLSQRLALDAAAEFSLSGTHRHPALIFGLSVIMGELRGHRGIDARMRDAQRRGDR